MTAPSASGAASIISRTSAITVSESAASKGSTPPAIMVRPRTSTTRSATRSHCLSVFVAARSKTSHRLSAADQVARQERLAEPDVADLVEAHRRVADRRHVGLVEGLLVPAAPGEVVVDDVAVLGLAAEEVLEGAAPERAEPVVPDRIGQLVEALDPHVASQTSPKCSSSTSWNASRQ